MRLLGRVFFWFLAVCGALALGLLGVWLGFLAMVQMLTTPDLRSFIQVSDRYEQDILDTLSAQDDALDCDRLVELIGLGTQLHIPGAWRGLAAAQQDGRCGQWPFNQSTAGGEPLASWWAEHIQSILKGNHGWRGTGAHASHLPRAIFNSNADSRRHHRKMLQTSRACFPSADWVIFPDQRRHLAEGILESREDFTSIGETIAHMRSVCAEHIFSLWGEELTRGYTDPFNPFPQPIWRVYTMLGYINHPDAAWLVSGRHPSWGQHVPHMELIHSHSSQLDWETELGRMAALRRPVALGHDEAARTLLSLEPFDWTRFAEDPELISSLQEDDAYATPFWMAVHAQRFSLPYVEQRRAAYEAEIGDECTALARRIGAMLPALYAQLPEDRPEVRDLILSSLACQPEGLREDAAYPGGAYWPPEIDRVAPDFTPRVIPEGWVWREGETH